MISKNEYEMLVDLLMKAVEPEETVAIKPTISVDTFKWHDTMQEVPDHLEEVEASFNAVGWEDKKYFYNHYCLYVPEHTEYNADFSDRYDLSADDIRIQDDILYVQEGWYNYEPDSAKLTYAHKQPDGWRLIEHYGENG